jgi:hypothetical protein
MKWRQTEDIEKYSKLKIKTKGMMFAVVYNEDS